MDDPAETVGNRSAARSYASGDGVFLTPFRAHSIQIVDISSTGARVKVRQRVFGSRGVMRWLGYNYWAAIAWEKEHLLGLKFDRPIEPKALKITIESYEFSPFKRGPDSVNPHLLQEYARKLTLD